MSTDELIPMDEAIDDFKLHLNSHPRTILSAKFGDGKSCFLDAAQKALKKDYEFITIYPVNYQIEENRDVYDLIKYDILFQLYSHKIASPESPIADDIAFPLFLQFYQKDITAEIFNTLSSLRISGKAGSVLRSATSFVKGLYTLKDRYSEMKESDSYLDKFMSQVEKNTHYESDPISGYITSVINVWHKKHRKKKLVLLIEDMDRMDPAHMFRILNIISAHIDDCYKYGVRPSASLDHNKFGFDNIVISLDYNNLQSIFHHFYGKDTSFEGYISKFSDRGRFNYSLEKEKNEFFKKRIAAVCEIDHKLVEDAYSDDLFKNKSLRDLARAMDSPEKQIFTEFEEGDWPVHLGLFKLMVILRRLGLGDGSIKDHFIPIGNNHPRDFFSLICSFICRSKLSFMMHCQRIVLKTDSEPDTSKGFIVMKEPDMNGITSISGYSYLNGRVPSIYDLNDCLTALLSHIGQ